MKKRTIRRITVLLGLVIVLVSLIAHAGTGTLSSFGWQDIAYICPLGSLEVLLASKTFVPRIVFAILFVLVLAILFGRFFCAWICPAAPVKRFLDNLFHRNRSAKGSKKEDADASEDSQVAPPEAPAAGSSTAATGCAACAEQRRASDQRRLQFDPRYVVLLATLLASVIFGFPVFCLFCPVGLVLGLVVAVWFMLSEATVNFTLLFIPIVLILELTVLRSWCTKFCPLGALFSLMSIPNRFFRPHVDKDKCLEAKGIACGACTKACDERLDPHTSIRMNRCTKCGVCQSVCPQGAITFPFLEKDSSKNTKALAEEGAPETSVSADQGRDAQGGEE